MGKMNNKGRSKFEPHIRLHRGVTSSSAWKCATCEEKVLMIEIWALHNGVNNGQIGYSHRQARVALRIGNVKVQQAFQGLQDKGFIVAHRKGHFDSKVLSGAGRATEWEITTEPCDGKPPSRLYRTWAEKQNTAPASGTAGSCDGNRSSSRIVQFRENGSDSGNRYASKVTSSGS
jgi:hypothetical protein